MCMNIRLVVNIGQCETCCSRNKLRSYSTDESAISFYVFYVRINQTLIRANRCLEWNVPSCANIFGTCCHCYSILVSSWGIEWEILMRFSLCFASERVIWANWSDQSLHQFSNWIISLQLVWPIEWFAYNFIWNHENAFATGRRVQFI